MNIAFLSYEFPEETGGGGIGTYLQLVTRLLSEKGHTVIVFAGTKKVKAFWETSSIFRVPSKGWTDFNMLLTDHFLNVHKKVAFDVVECTDFNGCGVYLKKKLPQLPIVVRLHTPLYMVDRLQFQPMSFFQKLRFTIGAFFRGKWPRLPLPPHADNYTNEFELVKLAERVSSPSLSIYLELKKLGFKLEDKTEIIPLPFEIPAGIMRIKTRESIKHDPQIVYIGRLELRKGVVDLAKSIPAILRTYPGARFTFVGESSISPQRGIGMIKYLQKMLSKHMDSIKFTGALSHEEAMSYLVAGDIFVFPSHYESFGLACCEAMAAGKAVIGSKQGGMAEIIENERSGLLVDAKNPIKLAAAIINLIDNEQLMSDLGHGGRIRIGEFLNPGKIVDSQINCYQRAINLCKINDSSLVSAVGSAGNDQ